MIYKLRIHDRNPETMPFDRLMEYASVFANLLGSKKKVHLLTVENQSVAPVFKISPEHEEQAAKNIFSVNKTDCSKTVKNNVIALRKLSSEDRVQVDIMRDDIVLHQFLPEPEIEEFELAYEFITVRGQLILIGGKDESLHFTLKDLHTGEKFTGEVNDKLAIILSEYFLKGEIDVSGYGQWECNKDGEYKLTNFQAESFTALVDGSTHDLVSLLKEVGSGWQDSKNPVDEAIRIRNDE